MRTDANILNLFIFVYSLHICKTGASGALNAFITAKVGWRVCS